MNESLPVLHFYYRWKILLYRLKFFVITGQVVVELIFHELIKLYEYVQMILVHKILTGKFNKKMLAGFS